MPKTFGHARGRDCEDADLVRLVYLRAVKVSDSFDASPVLDVAESPDARGDGLDDGRTLGAVSDLDVSAFIDRSIVIARS